MAIISLCLYYIFIVDVEKRHYFEMHFTFSRCKLLWLASYSASSQLRVCVCLMSSGNFVINLEK